MRVNFGGFSNMKKIILTIGITLLLCTIALSGCNEQKKPIISNFEAIPNEIELGQTSSLHWNVLDATSVTIDIGIGAVTSAGNRSVVPMETTTYTLTATGSTTVTAKTTITVNQPIEKPNISMIQTDFYIEITEVKNGHVLQSEVHVIAINRNSTVNQTSALGPMINDGDGNPNFLGAGDAITFQNLSGFSDGELWDIQLIYRSEIIGQCVFKNSKGPYDTPVVRMTQANTSVIIIGIINGPIDQGMCSITAINETSQEIQTSLLGASLTDKDGNPIVLGISDQIIFNSLGKFKAGDRWIIQLMYNGIIISQCLFTNIRSIIMIPT